jgi:hypothetical protein
MHRRRREVRGESWVKRKRYKQKILRLGEVVCVPFIYLPFFSLQAARHLPRHKGGKEEAACGNAVMHVKGNLIKDFSNININQNTHK